MISKYKEYTDYTINGETYWYASLFHMIGIDRCVAFGTNRYVHTHFYILMEGV